jgi:hypothetical protein
MVLPVPFVDQLNVNQSINQSINKLYSPKEGKKTHYYTSSGTLQKNSINGCACFFITGSRFSISKYKL